QQQQQQHADMEFPQSAHQPHGNNGQRVPIMGEMRSPSGYGSQNQSPHDSTASLSSSQSWFVPSGDGSQVSGTTTPVSGLNGQFANLVMGVPLMVSGHPNSIAF